MSRIERVLIVAILLFMAVLSINMLGEKYYALLACLEVLIGIIIGMVLFIPSNDGGY